MLVSRFYINFFLVDLVTFKNCPRWRVNGMTTDATCQQVVLNTLLQFVVTKPFTRCSNNLLRVSNLTTCPQHDNNLLHVYGLTNCQQVVPTTLLQFVVPKLVTSCSNNLLQVCKSTTCQQVVDNNLRQVIGLTSLKQPVQQVATSLLSQQLVDKLCVFAYVSNSYF